MKIRVTETVVADNSKDMAGIVAEDTVDLRTVVAEVDKLKS